MTHRTFAVLAFLPLSLVPLGAALESGASLESESKAPVIVRSVDLEALIAEEVATAADRDVASLWRRARELRDAERLGGEGELDRTLDKFLRKEGLSARAIILLAAARLQGDDPDSVLLMTAL